MMSELIKKTAENKAAEKAARIKNGYDTILDILENKLQGAEMLPGGLLKLVVDESVADDFESSLDRLGEEILCLGYGIRLWRPPTSRVVIYCEGVDPRNIDKTWESLIDEVKLRAEML